MAHPLHLLFAPHPHNNHKPKILWNKSLVVLMGLLVMGRSLIDIFAGIQPGVLGFASQIPPEKIIEYTNNARQADNLPTLTYNAKLAEAAQAKALDMFAHNYWAHVSPTGTEPWSFITNSGYGYLHAGENLARDFNNPKSVVEAWMASPTHKRNILDGRYRDIGIAVVDGYLDGVETTLVVQMFGVKQGSLPAVNVQPLTETAPARVVGSVLAREQPNVYIASGLSPFDAKKSWSYAFVIVIILALFLDWFIVWKNNLIRISGRTWAHLTFFLTLAAILFVIRQGLIL